MNARYLLITARAGCLGHGLMLHGVHPTEATDRLLVKLNGLPRCLIGSIGPVELFGQVIELALKLRDLGVGQRHFCRQGGFKVAQGD